MTNASREPPETKASAPLLRVPNASLAIAAFSTIVEWYDFTLYLYLAPVLARIFFPDSVHRITIVLAGFALAYVMRPLGAAVFG
jgi:MHS family proline/betaine transporter-like MFS transporter